MTKRFTAEEMDAAARQLNEWADETEEGEMHMLRKASMLIQAAATEREAAAKDERIAELEKMYDETNAALEADADKYALECHKASWKLASDRCIELFEETASLREQLAAANESVNALNAMGGHRKLVHFITVKCIQCGMEQHGSTIPPTPAAGKGGA